MHHGIPENLINMTVCQYEGSRCRVIHGCGLTKASQIRSQYLYDTRMSESQDKVFTAKN